VPELRRVAIVQELLAQYRVPFYEQLRDLLRSDGVELELIHGSARGARARRGDEANIPWATQVENRHVGPFVWQPVRRHLAGTDLVIVEQANRQLINYLLLSPLSPVGRVALWGHGGNLQGSSTSIRERWKKLVLRRAHWFFAYTDGSAQRARSAGFPEERVTVVNNASPALPADHDSVRIPGRCVFLGSLTPEKRLDVLVSAGDELSRTVQGFELIVIGDGEERARLEQLAEARPWLRVMGHRSGVEKAQLVRSAQLLLNPGLIGLVAVDSFHAETPLVAVTAATHSPEFEYLTPENSLVLPSTCRGADLAEATVSLLSDQARLLALRQGCHTSALHFTIEAMAHNFHRGILDAMESRSSKRADR
jgi:glycosyltransferase involved in cell wall biosynthesis